MAGAVRESLSLTDLSHKNSLSSAIAIAVLVGATALIVLAALGKLGCNRSRGFIGGMTAGGGLASSALLFLIISAVKNSHSLKNTNKQHDELYQRLNALERQVSCLSTSIPGELTVSSETMTGLHKRIKELEQNSSIGAERADLGQRVNQFDELYQRLNDLEQQVSSCLSTSIPGELTVSSEVMTDLRTRIEQLEQNSSIGAERADLAQRVNQLDELYQRLNALERQVSSCLSTSIPGELTVSSEVMTDLRTRIEQLEQRIGLTGENAGLGERFNQLKRQIDEIQLSLAGLNQQSIEEIRRELDALRIRVEQLTSTKPDAPSSATAGGALGSTASARETLVMQHRESFRSAIENLNKNIDLGRIFDPSSINFNTKVSVDDAIAKYDLFLIKPSSTADRCPPFFDESPNYICVTPCRDRGGQESVTAWLEANYELYLNYCTALVSQLAILFLTTDHPRSRSSYEVEMRGTVRLNYHNQQDDGWSGLYLGCPRQARPILDRYFSAAKEPIGNGQEAIDRLEEWRARTRRFRNNPYLTFNNRCLVLLKPHKKWTEAEIREVTVYVDWCNHLLEREEDAGYYFYPPRHQRYLRFSDGQLQPFIEKELHQNFDKTQTIEFWEKVSRRLHQDICPPEDWLGGGQQRGGGNALFFSF